MALTKIKAGGLSDNLVKNIVHVPINPITPSGGTAAIPVDNTLPQIGEGQQVLQYDYTPVSSSSTIFVHAYFIVAENANHSNAHQSAMFFNLPAPVTVPVKA